MTVQEILDILQSKQNDANLKGMAKYGINVSDAYGIKVVEIREMAKEIGTDHQLARQLWNSGRHEARILATIIADPALADSDMLDEWAEDLNSWDLCDQFCNNLVYKTAYAMQKILMWCVTDEPFIKRAGFSTMANYALKQPDLREKDIDGFLSLILNESGDKRNYVRKSVSWALRNIGKRSLHYNRKAVKIAKIMKADETKAARETAAETLKELQKSELLRKLKDKD